MNNSITYKVIVDFDFYLNDRMLNFVYLHIIGYDAVSLYRFLYNDFNYDQQMGTTKKKQNRIIEELGWDYQRYVKNKNILEAVGLIKTYLEYGKNDKIIFKLFQTNSWIEFKNNAKLVSLLKKNIDIVDYDRIRYLFEGNDILNNYIDISCTFGACFKDYHTQNNLTFDFNCLYDVIFKMYKKMITLSTSAKAIIETYFKNYELTFKEILNVSVQSIVNIDNNLSVDEKILRINLEKLVSLRDEKHINNIINVNRNHKIFLQDVKEENFDYVIEDYKTLNSEQYLSLISKSPLTQINRNLINILRKQYQLPDFIINVLIDYSIFKNAGRVEPNYLQKIAMTINRLNIDNIDQLLIHLRKSNQLKEGFKHE